MGCRVKASWSSSPRAKGAPLSGSTIPGVLLRTLGYGAIATVHGFRSSFRDWGAECSHFPREVLEHALAHSVGDASERAYARSKLFGKRRVADGGLGASTPRAHRSAVTRSCRCTGAVAMTRDEQVKAELETLKLPPARREEARVSFERALDLFDLVRCRAMTRDQQVREALEILLPPARREEARVSFENALDSWAG